MFTIAPIPSANQEVIRDQLLKNSQYNPQISSEVKELIQKLGSETASEAINAIIRKLNGEYYSKKTLPLFFLIDDLNKANCVKLAQDTAQRHFNDASLRPPRGLREQDLRIS